MSKTKKHRAATGAPSESQIRNNSHKNTPCGSYPEHLPRSMRDAWRQLAAAGEAWIDAGGAVAVKVAFTGDDHEAHLAGLIDHKTAIVDSIMGELADEGLQIDRSDRKPRTGAQA